MLLGSTVLLDDVVVSGCTAKVGGGIFVDSASVLVLNRTVVAANSAGRSGGIRLEAGAQLIATHALFFDNAVVGNGENTGAAIGCGGSTANATLSHCVVAANQAVPSPSATVLSSLDKNCTWILPMPNNNVVWGDVVRVSSALIEGGNEVKVSWFLPQEFVVGTGVPTRYGTSHLLPFARVCVCVCVCVCVDGHW